MAQESVATKPGQRRKSAGYRRVQGGGAGDQPATQHTLPSGVTLRRVPSHASDCRSVAWVE